MKAKDAVIEMMPYEFDDADLYVEILSRDKDNCGIGIKQIPVEMVSANYMRDGRVRIHIEQSLIDDTEFEPCR